MHSGTKATLDTVHRKVLLVLDISPFIFSLALSIFVSYNFLASLVETLAKIMQVLITECLFLGVPVCRVNLQFLKDFKCEEITEKSLRKKSSAYSKEDEL